MTKLILLVGIPASGKTTIGRALAERLHPHYTYHSSGERKRKLLHALNIRKSLSQLNQTETTLINALYYQELTQNTGQELTPIIDTHASYITTAPSEHAGTIVNLLPDHYLAHTTQAIILLQAHHDTITARRKNRDRTLDKIKDTYDPHWTAYEQQIETAIAQTFAQTHNIPILTTHNNELETSLNQIETYIKHHSHQPLPPTTKSLSLPH